MNNGRLQALSNAIGALRDAQNSTQGSIEASNSRHHDEHMFDLNSNLQNQLLDKQLESDLALQNGMLDFRRWENKKNRKHDKRNDRHNKWVDRLSLGNRIFGSGGAFGSGGFFG